jgi:phospholipid/cholesterol/gamma-HCH transport system substrate-binding protein
MRTWLAARARPLSVIVTVVLLLVAAGTGYVVLHDQKMKHATIYFPSTIGIYKGSSVRLLGVPVGQVDSVTPEGTAVEVTVAYKAGTLLPADVGMAQVPPSIVSDRYLQFTPAYVSGATLPDHAIIPEGRTEVPVELDQIFGSINDLDVALGPNGANKQGALSNLVNVGAANLAGNGAQFNATLKGFSQAVNALSNSRDALFGTITSLQKFTTTLAGDDGGVRAINGELSQVTGQLAGERTDLGEALANLATALTQVQTFVADNKDNLTHDIGSLTSVTSGLVGEQQAIKETLDEAPVALHNLALSFDPTAVTNGGCSTTDEGPCEGALSTRLNNTGNVGGLVCSLLTGALGAGIPAAVLATVGSACTTIAGSAGSAAPAATTPQSTTSTPTKGTGKAPITVPSVVPSLPSTGGLLGGLVGGGSSPSPSASSGSGSAPLGGLGNILLGGA